MENKLDVLTRKLYDEGLSKGKEEAQRLVEEADRKATEIIASAQAKAESIIKAAETKANELRKNGETELSLAGRQSLDVIKQNIEKAIVAKALDAPIKEANADPVFIREILLTLAANWEGAKSGKVELRALLPKDKEAKLGKEIEKSATGILQAGIEIGFSESVKSGFRVGPRDGSYYISFSDDDFKALLGEYISPLIYNLLFREG